MEKRQQLEAFLLYRLIRSSLILIDFRKSEAVISNFCLILDPTMSLPSPTKTYHTESYAAISPSRPELSTKGKHAFISGGGAGIGASIAQSLAKSGITSLGLLGRTTKTLQENKAVIEALNPDTKVHLYVADLTDAEQTGAALASFSEAVGGKIDILVANAAYMADVNSIPDSDPSDWWRAFEISVRGNFNLLRAFHPHAAAAASVIHVTTAAVHLPYMPGYSAYRASKSAATKLFEYYRYENPQFFVLQVHPGLIATSMTENIAPMLAELGLKYDDNALPGDFAVWALSGEAAFLNGRFVHVNWDVEELQGLREALEKDKSRFTIGLQGWF
ncbi:putative oxidoreductase C30D10.05c [Colletotrichum tanaceti]|uniref:Putative oxidoreductase C30D10.05c n=1 Tax=Colletotrichum tanaceti TaxID=1306861 RepID=A0A4U6XFD3_9PEZI|nr:putative oxidoreductase C30D10.05c [Colletotrichum tanaceti]KAJ0168975.1 putative oxidoreductase C30D10.05c [Colletotrichum tanaceti]TKW54558.1 putative oxidoreductase C30D10.05c [Colletotrichum tanaceti]